MDTFRVLNPNQVIYLDLTGSGNETAAHVTENGRMTIMFCSYGRQPMIMRLYTKARLIFRGDPEWDELLAMFPEMPGTRQIFFADVESVLTACGFGVPEYDLKRVRPTLQQWSEAKGEEGMMEYWYDNNMESIDQLPTGLKVEE